jgi:hypothetical protein
MRELSDRMLDLRPAQLIKLNGKELMDSIRASEGRTVACEIVCPVMPLFYDVTNAELAAAFGADMIILNLYDVLEPYIFGIKPETGETAVQRLKRLAGRPVGVNLEPIDMRSSVVGERISIGKGRTATRENARLAYEQGAALIVLTGNPKTGVTNESILKAIRDIREELSDSIALAAGKMHGAGIGSEMGEKIMSEKDVENFIDAGADIILVPAPGTVPGITVEFVKSIADIAHKRGVMIMTTIGTSQEGADINTIRNIALNCKMAGADIHHIGDAGYTGVAVPENITAYSIAIRGVRHTYRRMAMKE